MRELLHTLAAHPRMIPVFVTVGLILAGNGLIGPILPLYAQTFGVGATLVGFLLSAFGIARLMANIPTGLAQAYVGRRTLLCAGALMLGVAAVGAALAETFGELVAWRAVQGLGSGVYMTSSLVALAQLAPKEERSQLMSLYQGAMLFGASIGPAIGGALADAFGYTAPFWAHFLVAFGAFFIAFLVPKEHERQAGRKPAERPSGRKLLRQGTFVVACVVVFTVFFTRSASQWLLIPLLAHDKYEMSPAAIGFALTILATSNLVILPWTTTIIRSAGLGFAIVISLLVLVAGLLFVALGEGPAWFWAGIFFVGVGGGLNAPTISTYLIEIVPPELFGPSTALQRTAGDAGLVIGPIAMGMLNDHFAIREVGGMLANVAVLLLSASAFAAMTLRQKQI